MRNAATKGVRELRNRPAGGGKRAPIARKMLFGRNEAKELFKIKEFAFYHSKRTAFSGQQPPLKANNTAKNPPPVGICLSGGTLTSRYNLDGYSTSTCGLGARSVQLFPKCPPSQQRRRSGVGLASSMLKNRRWRSMYSKTRGPKGQKHAVSLSGRAPMASGAAVAVTLQPANQGDSETVKESLRGQKA